MKILFTGASSFTGFWFVRELAAAGHQIVATFQRNRDEYEGIRARRISTLSGSIEAVWNCSFGDDRFLDLIHSNDAWNLLCHHAADVTNYKSTDFNVISAVSSNTRNIRKVLAGISNSNTVKVLFTGSVFEPGEGAGSEGLPAFSPYGMSKSLSWQLFQYYCADAGIQAQKFVIPNPFGPFEDARFTAYLVDMWKSGKVAKVNTPAYVRDNIHVSLLAKAYRSLAEDERGDYGRRLGPTGYVENQGQFALRVAAEMRLRTSLECGVELAVQKEFSEPRVRMNTDVYCAGEWDETSAWNDFCRYYLEEGS